MLKVGLIGCGGMGHTHAAGYEDLKDKVKVVAVADVREDKCADLKDTFGCDVYKTGMELIENADVDYVDICVPTYLHAEHAVFKAQRYAYLGLGGLVCRCGQVRKCCP